LIASTLGLLVSLADLWCLSISVGESSESWSRWRPFQNPYVTYR